MRMARRPHGPRSRGITIVARTNSADTSGASLERVFFEDESNGISGVCGPMDARMRRHARREIHCEFPAEIARIDGAGTFRLRNLWRGAGARRQGGAARHAGRQCRYFAWESFPGIPLACDTGRAFLRPNYDRLCASARANGVRIPHSASNATTVSFVMQRDWPVDATRLAGRRDERAARLAREAGSQGRSTAGDSRCVGTHRLTRPDIERRGRVFTDRRAPAHRRGGARHRAVRPPSRASPLPALARVARYRPTFASGRTAHATAAGPIPADGAGRQPAAARIGARDRHGGEHACQKNIGSWYWTTIRKCAPG